MNEINRNCIEKNRFKEWKYTRIISHQIIDKLKDMGYFIYAADMNGDNYKKVDYASKKVLIIGNEGDGISRLTRENSDVIVSIPIEKNVESLNASVAAGIIIYRMLD